MQRDFPEPKQPQAGEELHAGAATTSAPRAPSAQPIPPDPRLRLESPPFQDEEFAGAQETENWSRYRASMGAGAYSSDSVESRESRARAGMRKIDAEMRDFERKMREEERAQYTEWARKYVEKNCPRAEPWMKRLMIDGHVRNLMMPLPKLPQSFWDEMARRREDEKKSKWWYKLTHWHQEKDKKTQDTNSPVQSAAAGAAVPDAESSDDSDFGEYLDYIRKNGEKKTEADKSSPAPASYTPLAQDDEARPSPPHEPFEHLSYCDEVGRFRARERARVQQVIAEVRAERLQERAAAAAAARKEAAYAQLGSHEESADASGVDKQSDETDPLLGNFDRKSMFTNGNRL